MSSSLSADELVLLERARSGLANSYSPYSHFPVSAVLVTMDGTVFTGVNVENASYGATICAERSAIVSAVSAGHRRFQKLLVISKLPEPCSPCGICRQFIVEFGDFEVLLAGADGGISRQTSLSLLPLAFTPTELNSIERKADN